MELHELSGGQKLWTHDPDDCKMEQCCIHNPSDHVMKDFPQHWRGDKGMMERICLHGVGHDDPDDVAYRRSVDPSNKYIGVHGCDGCCA